MQVREKVVISTVDESRNVEVMALFDTGAKSTFIDEEVAKKLGYRRYPKPVKIPLAVKGEVGEVVGESTLLFTIAGCKIPFGYTARVVRNLAEEVIIGSSFMEEFDIELDLKEGKARLLKSPPELRLI